MFKAYLNEVEQPSCLRVVKRPTITKPQKDIVIYSVPGRDGFCSQDLGTYREFTIQVQFKVRHDVDLITAAYEIRNWIGNGKVKLTFSDDIEKYYEAKVLDQYAIEEEVLEMGDCTINFLCQPHRKELHPQLIADPITIYNSGEECKPVITLYGSGATTLTINGITISFSDIDGYVKIDAPLMNASKDTTLKNDTMTGGFPVLIKGENTISHTGTSIEIQPNFRWLG